MTPSFPIRGNPNSKRRLITVADDFGLSPAVNEAVERANRKGALTSASLMVAGAAAEDAIARARRCPGLRVGLHLVVIEGPAVLPPQEIALLVNSGGWFPSNGLKLGFDYAFSPARQRQLRSEIRAQFEAFRRAGLPLDHANAHKHMHLHPVIAQMMIAIGREYGLRSIRLPREKPLPGEPQLAGDKALRWWCTMLQLQARQAGMRTNDWIFGLSHSGAMTLDYVQHVIRHLPPGTTEMYFHPAVEVDAVLRRWMPTYDHVGELAALLGMRPGPDVALTTYSDI
jgi:hopanoid biosynthesis associated protein HpnK